MSSYGFYSLIWFVLVTSVVNVSAIEPATAIFIASAVTALGQGVFSYMNTDKAMKEQKRENRRAEAIELEMHEESMKEAKRQFGLNLDLEERGFKNAKQQKAFENSRAMVGTFMNALKTNDKATESFYRRAASSNKENKIIGGEK